MTQLAPNTPVIISATGEAGVVARFVACYGPSMVYEIRVGRKLSRYADNEFEAIDLTAPQTTPIVGTDAVRRLITHLKVAFQLQGQLASLDGTRTQFFPYQYKPLLKLERSQLDRVLVADEVGLGKTIEAGFIVLETIARQPFADVVVVCPPMLRAKWRKELFDRFGLEFSILRRQEATEYIAHGIQPLDKKPIRAIVAYETIRCEAFREALDSETTQRRIDLLIADEAHRARNSRALQSKALEALCDRTYTRRVVFLTATPLQTSQQDLYRLLSMLLPGEFPDEATFSRRTVANEAVVLAERAVSSGDRAKIAEALAALERCTDTLITANPFYEPALSELRALATATDRPATEELAARVRTQEALFQVNLLSPVLTRTRRRDVHEGIAMREARAVDARLTAYEQWAYDLVTNAIFDEYKRRFGDQVARFVLKGFQARLASSLPAAIADYRARLGVPERDEDLDHDQAEESEMDSVALPDNTDFPILAKAVSQVDVRQLEADDSKWKLLRSVLEQHLQLQGAGAEPRKLIIFSYYKRSLDLIGRKLSDMGLRFERIDGDVPTDLDPELDERQHRIRRFRGEPDIRVMLASQVGCEGLDFQFCDTIINWDLPWNPMMVEQRIGRIDRIGQKAKRIFVVNIACQGTVEWEILQRLYLRLDLFRSSIGDLEEVLGPVESQLQDGLFDPNLTDAQKTAVIEQAAQACEVRKRQLQELLKHSEHLIGQDRFLVDEVERLRRAGRYLSHEDLERFIRERVKVIDPRSSVTGPDRRGIFTLQIETNLMQHLSHAGAVQRNREWARVHGHIRAGRYEFALQPEVSSEGVDLLSAAHPLVRALLPTEDHEADGIRKAFGTTLSSVAVEPGRWAMLITRIDYAGARRASGLLCSVANLDTGAVHTDTSADALLTDLLNAPPRHLEIDALSPEFKAAESRAIDAMQEHVNALAKSRRDHAERTASRRRAVCEAHYGNLIGQVERQLLDQQSKGSPDARILRLMQGRKARFERDRDTELASIERVPREGIAQTDVFIGLLGVTRP